MGKREAIRIPVLRKYLAQAEHLAEKNGGEIPAATRLKRMGRINLYHYMLKHPDWFLHLSQEVIPTLSYRRSTLKSWKTLAKQLARKNGRILPGTRQLRAMGYKALAAYIEQHPNLFEDITQEEEQTVAQIHLEKAEEIADAHGGKLPGGGAVVEEGGWALYMFIYRNLRLFSHLSGSNNGTQSRHVGKKTKSRKKVSQTTRRKNSKLVVANNA